MNIKKNQTGAAHIVAIIIVVVIVLAGFAGWKVWDSQKQDNTATSQNSNSTNNSATSDTGDETVESIKINALGIKVNDPAGRKLQLHAEKICAADCADEDSYFIRDDNNDYYGRCGYPTGVTKLEQTYVTENPEAGLVKYSKKIGDSYYAATLGSNFQSPCGETKDEDYVTELRQYVVDNMEAL